MAAAKAPIRDPQALALLAQCGTAMGGASIQDMSATGTLTTADPKVSPLPIITQSKGAAERFDIFFPDDAQTYVLNGGDSWSVQQGKQTDLPYALIAYRRPEHTPALACILDIQNPNMSFAYIDQEKFQNGLVEHIRISLPTVGMTTPIPSYRNWMFFWTLKHWWFSRQSASSSTPRPTKIIQFGQHNTATIGRSGRS